MYIFISLYNCKLVPALLACWWNDFSLSSAKKIDYLLLSNSPVLNWLQTKVLVKMKNIYCAQRVLLTSKIYWLDKWMSDNYSQSNIWNYPWSCNVKSPRMYLIRLCTGIYNKNRKCHKYGLYRINRKIEGRKSNSKSWEKKIKKRI